MIRNQILKYVSMNRILSIVLLMTCFVPSCFAITQSQRNAILSSHNLVRSEYHLPKLIWDTKIEKQAQEWASTMMKNNTLAHSPSTFRRWMWENIYSIVSSGQRIISDGSDATMLWYSEQPGYDSITNSCRIGSVCGHFTQMIWKTTQRIGCGQSTKKKGNTTTIYWVCQYDPPGNYEWQRPY